MKRGRRGARIRTYLWIGVERDGLYKQVPAVVDTGSSASVLVPQRLVKKVRLTPYGDTMVRRGVTGTHKVHRAKAYIRWPEVTGKSPIRLTVFLSKNLKKKHVLIGMRLMRFLGAELRVRNKVWKLD